MIFALFGVVMVALLVALRDTRLHCRYERVWKEHYLEELTKLREKEKQDTAQP